MLRKLHGRNSGFTLVEVLIVIVVIGVLAMIAVPQLRLYAARSYVGITRTDAKNAHTAVIKWIMDNPGSSVPEVNGFTGPGELPSFGSARISPGVIISISNSGDVTASHQGLSGSYKIHFSGAQIEDSLSVQ